MRDFRMCGTRLSMAMLALVAVLAGGCAQEEGPELGSVTGTVTKQGRPVPGVRVVFSLGHSRPSAGITDEQGRYELRYTGTRNGALLGRHKVQFYSESEDSTDESFAPVKGQDSELVREVKAGTNVFDFEL